MENASIFFVTNWNILRPFGIYGRLVYVVGGHLVYFSRFGMFGPRKIWQPGFQRSLCWLACVQGDQIGLIFANLVTVYFGSFF
jgi:hypothetical protein